MQSRAAGRSPTEHFIRPAANPCNHSGIAASEQCAERGTGTRFDITSGELTLDDAAWRHLDSPADELRSLVRIEWDAMDVWLEEDVEVFVHPRDPYTRVDTLSSSRHVRVLVDGEVIDRPSTKFS